jgi:hypothetical protein
MLGWKDVRTRVKRLVMEKLTGRPRLVVLNLHALVVRKICQIRFFFGKPDLISNDSRIFCIGFNKTGTTTLAKILEDLGYFLPDQRVQEILFLHLIDEVKLGSTFRSFINRYTAFQDVPFSQGTLYQALARSFPNAKFILTIRDPDQWFNSLKRYHRQQFNIEEQSLITEESVITRFNYLYPIYMYRYTRNFLRPYSRPDQKPDWSRLYDRKWYIGEYNRRNTEIIDFFSDATDRLLVIDLTKEKTTEKINNFLNLGDREISAIPHLNSSDRR